MPEARLAREAELCYATLALATDYDCWRAGHEAVTAEQVIAVLNANVALAREVVRNAALALSRLERPLQRTRRLPRHARHRPHGDRDVREAPAAGAP
jgi:hypothetical protein